MTKTLEILINQSEEIHKNNTKKLGDILTQIEASQRLLHSTIENRDNYIHQFHEKLKGGMSMQSLMQYNTQISNMENIIHGYEQNIVSYKSEHQLIQSQWYHSYKTIKSYQLLYEQQQHIIEVKNNKLEQKNMDEYATRFFWYNQQK